tara:strand:- start:222 stop:698 length:477 start_codon:yes stop_codon:yes gene_type:complete
MGVRAFVYDSIQSQLTSIQTADGHSITVSEVHEFNPHNHRWDESHNPVVILHYAGEELSQIEEQQDIIGMAFQITLFMRNKTHHEFLELIDDVYEVLSVMEEHPTGHSTLSDVAVDRMQVTVVDTAPDLESNVDGIQQGQLTVEVLVRYGFQRHGSSQ